MNKCYGPLGLLALSAAFLLACLADTRGQDKGAQPPAKGAEPPDKAAQDKGKGAKGGKGAFGGGKGAKSPEVSADGSVTFRLPLPSLQKVELDGDFKERGTKGTIPMTKDDKGMWTVTVKVPPGSYQYWFIADGFTMPDPSNTHVRPASGVYKSQFEVPGNDISWMAVRDVPHGTLHEHTYFNKDNATYRRLVVYTPPSYEGGGTKTYPVLYLLHGANDFERGWTQAGRANWIMDNLIADGKAVPMIVVMPFGHATSGSTGKAPEVKAIQAAHSQDKPGGWTMEKDVLNNIIPLVEKEYRVIKDKEHRAIIGYSMGGGHSTSIGLNHPETFVYVGGMSGYTGEGGIKKLLADPAKTNKDFKLIWIGCGTDDAAINGGRTLDKLFTSKGINHQWTESPGYRHDYQIWRVYLKDFATQLFKDPVLKDSPVPLQGFDKIDGFTNTPLLPGTKWHLHDSNRPQPPVITPGASFSQNAPAPSDAEVLFDGKNLSKWQTSRGQDATWKVQDGYVETGKGGGIRTRGKWADFQLHVEWSTPTPPKGTGQGRGNSGIIINGLYEVQVLDSYQSKTYADGQAGAIYGQSPPLVNASLPPGQWQTYDIIFESPRWNDKGELVKKAIVTVLHNGVVIQNHQELTGITDGVSSQVPWKSLSKYGPPHSPEVFIELQDHNNPVRFRNIWIRCLGERDKT